MEENIRRVIAELDDRPIINESTESDINKLKVNISKVEMRLEKNSSKMKPDEVKAMRSFLSKAKKTANDAEKALGSDPKKAKELYKSVYKEIKPFIKDRTFLRALGNAGASALFATFVTLIASAIGGVIGYRMDVEKKKAQLTKTLDDAIDAQKKEWADKDANPGKLEKIFKSLFGGTAGQVSPAEKAYRDEVLNAAEQAKKEALDSAAESNYGIGKNPDGSFNGKDYSDTLKGAGIGAGTGVGLSMIRKAKKKHDDKKKYFNY